LIAGSTSFAAVPAKPAANKAALNKSVILGLSSARGYEVCHAKVNRLLTPPIDRSAS
jgi:hypothetical protein